MSAPPGGNTAASGMRWLGHASTLIVDRGTVVLTDPVLTDRVAHLRRRRGPTPLGFRTRHPDVVLLSHLHADHTHLPSLRLLDPDVPIVVPWRAMDGLPALRRFGDRLVPLRPGDETRIGAVTVRAVPAHHDGRRWRRGPQLAPAVGYVVEGDRRTYFAGDTDLYPGLEDHVGPGVDLALLPVGGWGPTLGDGHLDPPRAVVAARLVEAALAVPIHYGTLWPIGFDAVRPRSFFGPGAEFVHHAERAGLMAVELRPGDALGGSDGGHGSSGTHRR
ncbi:MBL fold metallo-hydrolase [Rhodococcus sp. HM1]|uniref:MBL fold metallo-hydrolase n=1 Tax=unclassified Rhodococcus (in: high G+C Gram-positive bacteria) TaxID=192944 RepID=UPI0018CF7BD5|nr:MULTISPECIES: MBL fold metallo-hydrolase [unclassified Rhodococcus (in: high G+C Gram-positive bacteria)]MBH0122643.1 MBL fold metallo-hydrolase [Rhodococcus sp. CX]MCK8673718.1 MBL fold metallo-hydrolase [Rhodococcus sp. HM1]